MKRVFFIVTVVLFIGIIMWNYSKRLTKTDREYIITKEWLSKSGSVIRFDDASETLINDTIYSHGKPYCKLLSINNDKNEISVFSFSKKKKLRYMNTEVFEK